MAYLPLPTPPVSRLPEPTLFLPQTGWSAHAPGPPDSNTILATVREVVASGTHAPDIIFGAIAEAAQVLTEANAAALAVQTHGIVVCRGRSGDMAPDLGTRLTVDSGISGDCLRTGKTYRCDDALKDFRVNPETCRRMGLRSIAVVPLRDGHKVVGVLEAFSTRAYAFAEEHMETLARLAALAATTTHAPAAEFEESAKVHPEQTSRARVSATLLRAKAAIPAGWRVSLPKTGRPRYLAGAAIIVLAAVAFGNWRVSRKGESAVALQHAPVPSQTVPVGPSGSAGALLVWKANPPQAMDRTNRGPVSRPPRSTAKLELAGPAENSPAPNPTQGPSAGTTEQDPTPNLNDPPAEPAVAAANLDNRALGNLVLAPVSLPTLGAPISEGVSQGFLEHKVEPRYPPQALRSRLEGTVVLQAIIAEDGKVRDLKVLSGNPNLVFAAVTAVKQWRYRPYLLNGKPTKMQTDITVRFKAP